ncbi:MAG: MFS transporter [Pyrobaculum sp.]
MRTINLATLLFFTANGVAIVAIPPYLRDLGVQSESVIGAVVSTAFFVSIVARPLSGFLGERVGYARLMGVGVALAVAAQLMYLLGSPGWVQVGRVFHGLAIATFLPMSIALSVVEGARAIAARSLAVGVGNVLGPLAGSAIYDVGGAKLSFTTALAIHAANWVLVRGAGGAAGGGSREPGLRVESRVFLFMALLTIYAATYMSISTFIPVKLRDHGMPLTYWGLFTSVAALVSLLPRAFLMKAGLVNPVTAAVATAVTLVGMWLATYAEDPLAFAISGAVYGLGQGAVVVTYQILALSGSKRAGLSSSIYTMGWDLGSIIGPIAGGALVESMGYSALHVIPLAMALDVAVLFLYAIRR